MYIIDKDDNIIKNTSIELKENITFDHNKHFYHQLDDQFFY